MNKEIVTKKMLFDAINEEGKRLKLDLVDEMGDVLFVDPAEAVGDGIKEDSAGVFTVNVMTFTKRDSRLLRKVFEAVAKRFRVKFGDKKHSVLEVNNLSDETRETMALTCNCTMSETETYRVFDWTFAPNGTEI